MNKLIWFDFVYVLQHSNFADMRSHCDFSEYMKVFSATKHAAVDRTQTYNMPVSMTVISPLEKCKDSMQEYADACDSRALQLLSIAEQKVLSIYVMWSGGIDSTGMLAALLKNSTLSQRQQITVLLTQGSIKENPEFFKRFIIGKIDYSTALDFNIKFDNSTHMLLCASTNDQLFGSNPFHFDGSNDSSDKPTVEMIQAGMFDSVDIKTAEKIKFILENTAASRGIELLTLDHHRCWYQLCFCHQYVQARFLSYFHHTNSENVMEFYNHDDFDQWSMQRYHKPVLSLEYKKECKQYIFDFDKNQDYLENKQKVNSGSRLITDLRRINVLGADRRSVPETDFINYYEPNNIFLTSS